MFYYAMITSATVLYSFMIAIINHHQDLHIIPTYENCIGSEIRANPTKIFSYFIVPIIITFFVTLFFDSNIWQISYSTHVNVKDIYSAIFSQTSIKSSVLTFLILLGTLLSLLLTKWLQLSVSGDQLVIHSFVLPLLIVKGPYILSWTYQTDVKNLEEARHNYMILKKEIQNKPFKMESSIENSFLSQL